MSESSETGRAERTSQQPPRSYEVPGGPLARDLGTINVYKLSEIIRGGLEDRAR